MRQISRYFSFALLMALVAGIFVPGELDAQRRHRTVVVRRGPVVRTRVVVRPGHPITRSVTRTVVVRPARRTIVVGAPIVWLPVLAFTAAVVTLPERDRLVWQDTETIDEDEDWVDCNFGVDARGDALYLNVDGRAELDFAEVTFENGHTQVVDFNEKTYNNGTYRLLDFADGRKVMTVRLLAKSKSEETQFTVYLRK
jgi:hypothetical protein